ncbi:MAG: hypothetical protein F6J98_02725 [Moorea sp. SIO4G2]|nr:hypothetical protein [Moorena sp. SIO4G2]
MIFTLHESSKSDRYSLEHSPGFVGWLDQPTDMLNIDKEDLAAIPLLSVSDDWRRVTSSCGYLTESGGVKYFTAKYIAPIYKKDNAQVDEIFQNLKISEGKFSIIFAIAPKVNYRSPIFRRVKDDIWDKYKSPGSFYYDRWQTDLAQKLRDFPSDYMSVIGLDTLNEKQIQTELQQLNLSRDAIVSRGTTLIYWLQRKESLDFFREFCPDMWDFRSLIIEFEDDRV